MITTTAKDALGTKYVFQVAQHECDDNPIDCLNWELARACKGNLRFPRDQEKQIAAACSRVRQTLEQSEQDKQDMALVMQYSMHVNKLTNDIPELANILRTAHRDNAAVQKALFANRVLKQDFKSLENKIPKLMHGYVYFDTGCKRPTFLDEPTKEMIQGVAVYKWNGAQWERVEDKDTALKTLEPRGYAHSVFLTGKSFEDATVSQFGKDFSGCFIVVGFE